MDRVTLRERFFQLHQPDDLDRFLARFEWAVVFKGGTSDKTVEAWLVAQRTLEPRVDVAVGFVRLPEDRAASDRVSALTGIEHRSPQLILFHRAGALFHLDEFAIVPTELVPRLRQALPAETGSPIRNEAVATLEPYRRLLAGFLAGELPEERFQWGYLDRLAKDACWRDDETFDLLNSLFENDSGREVTAARLVAVEFQGQLAGRLEPLRTRAARLLERLAER